MPRLRGSFGQQPPVQAEGEVGTQVDFGRPFAVLKRDDGKVFHLSIKGNHDPAPFAPFQGRRVSAEGKLFYCPPGLPGMMELQDITKMSVQPAPVPPSAAPAAPQP